MRLKDKKLLITGGNSGIGFAVAAAAIREGAQVWVHGRSPEKVDQAVEELGRQARPLYADVSSVKELRRMAERLRGEIDGLDGLVVNAGTAFFTPLAAVDEQFFDELVNVNFKGVFFTIQSLLPLLGRGAAIVMNGSVAGKKALPDAAIYSASKAAVRSLARTMAPELALRDIRINVVSPGPVLTPLIDKQSLSSEAKAGLLQAYKSMTLMGRAGIPDDIAPAFIFLLSDEARFITGAEFDIDGGMAQV